MKAIIIKPAARLHFPRFFPGTPTAIYGPLSKHLERDRRSAFHPKLTKCSPNPAMLPSPKRSCKLYSDTISKIQYFHTSQEGFSQLVDIKYLSRTHIAFRRFYSAMEEFWCLEGRWKDSRGERIV
ncbi:hypothetical protein [Leisingera sp.]|uniref:hypothetical protein n=1 Tax=Leisingera sp. TaxID=1879318 RepID=UPI002B26C383|nr:hypothetical protein [Leisingera sp.]